MSPADLPHRRLVAGLFGTLKVMQLYGREHATTRDALHNLGEAITATAEDGEACIRVRGHRLLVNGRTMRSADCGHLALAYLTTEWARRRIEAIRIVVDAGDEDLANFAEIFLDFDPEDPDPAAAVTDELRARAVTGVHVDRLVDEEADPVVLEERRESAMRTYMRGLRAFKDVLRWDGVNDPRSVRRARRAVQGLVDRFLEDEAAVLALAQLRGHDERLFRHSLNVCVYALLLGQRLGMSRRQLGEIGIAALFHDVGRTLGRRKGETRAEELAHHPARGARLLLAQGTAHEGMLKAALAAYEHHLHLDGTGFPEFEHEPHLVSRLVAIVDCYETLTSRVGGGETTHTAYDVLTVMQGHAGTMFDPLLIKVFANALGLYPVGTLVQLSSGEVGLVVEGPADEDELGRPRVKVLLTAGGVLPKGEIVDVMETDDEGLPVRNIERTLAPDEVFDDTSEYVKAIQ